MKPSVFVARRIPEIAIELLSKSCDVRVHEGALPPTRDELIQGVEGCHGILSLLSDRIDDEVLDAAGSNLRVVSNFAVGFNNIDIAAANHRRIAVGNTPDVLTDSTADIAVALMLSAARLLPKSAADARSGGWRTWEPLGWIGQDLRSKTLGIVGMGRIGEAVARRMHLGWGMDIVYTSRSPKSKVDAELKARHVSLPELCRQSDFVSVHVALSPDTNALIGAAEFEAMNANAVFVNTARGEVVDQPALVEALESKQIFAAGLDVCTPEPLPLEHKLFSLDNCIVVPHIGSATIQSRNAMATRAAENILAGLAGKPLPYPVN